MKINKLPKYIYICIAYNKSFDNNMALIKY